MVGAQLMNEGRGVSHGGAGDVETFVRHLRPCTHSGARDRRCGAQRMLRENVLDIFENDSRLADRLTIMDKDGNEALGIDGEKGGLEMFASHQVDLFSFVGEPLFVERDPHLLCADRDVVVIERQHVRIASWDDAETMNSGGLQKKAN